MNDIWAEHARKEAARSAAWQKAVDKLSITFEADQRYGGYPGILVSAGSEEARLQVLRDLGFRVRERWEMDNAAPGCPPDIHLWMRVTGNISVNLTAGFVIRSQGVRTR